MRVMLTESAASYMENTIIGDVAESETIKDLVENARCLDLLVIYTNNLGHRNVFRIYDAGVFNEDEYSCFLHYGELANIRLLTDDYDVFIKSDTFEKECVIEVTEY